MADIFIRMDPPNANPFSVIYPPMDVHFTRFRGFIHGLARFVPIIPSVVQCIGSLATFMKWQEIIHLRSAEKGMESLRSVMAERCLALHQISGLDRAEIFEAVDCDGDLAMIMYWDIEGGAAQKSQAGLLLAEYLEKFGLVNHKVLKQVFPPAGVTLRGGY